MRTAIITIEVDITEEDEALAARMKILPDVLIKKVILDEIYDVVTVARVESRIQDA